MVSLEKEGWEPRRERLVEEALERKDVGKLRSISALPGGFGTLRKRVWPVLLDVENLAEPSSKASSSKHRDEDQVLLDTKRSFVVYPRGIPQESKTIMQQHLYDIIVGVLRKYPRLSYFQVSIRMALLIQGYHDIISVFYLTYSKIPRPARSRSNSRAPKEHDNGLHEKDSEEDGRDQETLRRCAEVLSVTRIRDAMSENLEGMMGLLRWAMPLSIPDARILKRILRVADPDLYRFSSMISPVPTLPFFALSWILCLFSHDVDTLEPVQRMFDFLLARNPISAVYMAVAILILKKPEMLQLAKKLGKEGQQDPTLLHPLFARLPPLYADTPDSEPPHIDQADDPNPYTPIPLSKVFALTDDLVRRYPFTGKDVKGLSILGEGSVVLSYRSREPLEEQLHLLDEEIVKPGAGSAEDDDEGLLGPRRRLLLPRNKLGTGLAVSILVLSVGLALYNSNQLDPWRVWWVGIARNWMRRTLSAWDWTMLHFR